MPDSRAIFTSALTNNFGEYATTTASSIRTTSAPETRTLPM